MPTQILVGKAGAVRDVRLDAKSVAIKIEKIRTGIRRAISNEAFVDMDWLEPTELKQPLPRSVEPHPIINNFHKGLLISVFFTFCITVFLLIISKNFGFCNLLKVAILNIIVVIARFLAIRRKYTKEFYLMRWGKVTQAHLIAYGDPREMRGGNVIYWLKYYFHDETGQRFQAKQSFKIKSMQDFVIPQNPVVIYDPKRPSKSIIYMPTMLKSHFKKRRLGFKSYQEPTRQEGVFQKPLF